MGKYRITEAEFRDAFNFWLEDDDVPEGEAIMFLQQLGVEVAALRTT